MEVMELNELCSRIELLLSKALPALVTRVSVGYPESPNPLCFFEVDGACFAQGSFWSNNEYNVEGMTTDNPKEFLRESGSVQTIDEALGVVQRFCDAAIVSLGKPISFQ